MTNGEATTIVAGMAVYISAADTVKMGLASAMATSNIFGIVTAASIAASAIGNVQHVGVVSLATALWDAVTGQSGGLTAGSMYYLDPATAGHMTTTVPGSGNIVAVLGQAKSTTDFKFQPRLPEGPLP
jgi:hypothetical protein